MTAHEIPDMTPGDPHWARLMTASKIAAVVDLSPYESRFSLWHKMAGHLPWDDGTNTDEKARGHYLEPALRQWWRDRTGRTVTRTGTWQHDERPWQVASPDGLTVADNGNLELLECKTSTKDYEWGPDGTDQIAPYYLPQVQWAMDTLGATRCHVPVLTSYMTFQAYVVDYDPDYAAWLRDEARTFLDTLQRGIAPSIDDHTETYKAVRHLHPGIDDVDITIPDDLAARYLAAQAAEKDAATTKRGVVTELAALMGTARTASTADGITIAYRKPTKTTPCISPAPGAARRIKEHAA